MKQKLLLLCLSFFFFNVNAQLSVDCTTGPLNETYCYSNSSSNLVTYTSADGSPLNLTIISGEVENAFDELVILDSDGVTNLNAANPYGNSGDISGLTFQSSGDSITFSVSSDVTVSCASGSFSDGINYTVSCSTCSFVIDLGFDSGYCGFNSIMLNAESPLANFYEWFFNGIIIPDENGGTLIASESGTYSVFALSDACNFTASDSVDLSFGDEPSIYQDTFFLCDDSSGDGVESFDLASQIPGILGNQNPQDFNVSIHLTLIDAQQGLNPIQSPFNNITNPQIIYTRVEDLNATYCNIVSQLTLEVLDCENAGLINVNAFYDVNGNSVFDDNESSFINGYITYELNSDGFINNASSSTGSFTLVSFTESDSYDIGYYFYNEYQDCYDVSIATFDNISVTNGSEITIDFPVIDDQSCEDIAVYLIGNSSPQPGFSYTNYLSIENLGMVTTSGSIDFTLDSNLVLNSVSTNSNYTVTTTASGFTLDFVNLQPGFSINAQVSLYCPNTVPIGELVTNVATLTTTENDTVAGNNSSTLTETVIGSYDPNDIMESHGRQIVYDDFITSDEYFYYTIRFQNIGTAEASTVRIEDVLDTQLDHSTFRMLYSSHDYVVTRTANQLVWQFSNINLPSESMDAEGSNGFVYFKIKPQVGYAIGDVIPNVADIYFDFNPPITTNTFITEFVETLSIDDYDTTSFSIHPNPANDIVNIRMNGSLLATFNVEVFDIQGKHVLSHTSADENTMQLNVSSLESGLYFIKIKTGLNETIKKLIVN